MTPSEFHPTFITDITAWNNEVNPRFCATDQCAKDLQELLSKDRPCKLVELDPLSGIPKTDPSTALVPWCQFPTDVNDNGYANVNAGVLADTFMHGKNPDVAYGELLAHIDQSIKDSATS
jgi:hypothetical protein